MESNLQEMPFLDKANVHSMEKLLLMMNLRNYQKIEKLKRQKFTLDYCHLNLGKMSRGVLIHIVSNKR